MNIFNKPNTNDNWKCIICNKNDIKPVTLIGIDGTQEGANIQAIQVHVDCINLTYFRDNHIIAQLL